MTANTYGRQVVVPLTNKSGGSVAAGDVVVIDTTNNDAFTTTTSASSTVVVGIAQETIANNATGRVLMSGYAALVNVPASVTRGHYLFTHTVAKQATGSASRAAGAFGQFLTGGTTPDAHIFGITDPSIAGLVDPMTTRGDIIVRNASNVTARLAKGTATYVLTSDGTDVAWAAPGGGGSDLVQTHSGSGSVRVPGLRGSPDVEPASPNAADDEFEALSGWTTLGTLDTSNVSDFPSHWHAKRTNVGVAIDGIYKTAPSMPFTVTAKLVASNIPANAAGTGSRTNYNHAGILLTESGPGKCTTVGFVVNGGTIYCSVYRWTNRTTLATNVDTSTGSTYTYGPTNNFSYIRIVVASSTDISVYLSRDGFLWWPVTSQQNITSGLTVANVGLAIGDAAAAGTTEAVFDWIRFT